MIAIGLIIGLVVGAAAVWVALRARTFAERKAQEQLATTFRALASDALRTNNEEFLHLATTSLERFQIEARGDLEQRRQAVEQLVAPLKDSLAIVDRQGSFLATVGG